MRTTPTANYYYYFSCKPIVDTKYIDYHTKYTVAPCVELGPLSSFGSRHEF